MELKVKCINCGHEFTIEDSDLLKEIECPNCQEVLLSDLEIIKNCLKYNKETFNKDKDIIPLFSKEAETSSHRMILLADSGNVRAQVSLAKGFISNHNKDEGSLKIGLLYLRKALQQGDAEAKFVLANCYTDNIIPCPDIKLIPKLYKESFEGGVALSGVFYAACFHEGTGCEVDYKKELEIYKEIVKVKEDLGYSLIADYYYQGYYEKVNIELALAYFIEGARKGNIYAKMRIFFMEIFHKDNSLSQVEWKELLDSLKDDYKNNTEELISATHGILIDEIRKKNTEAMKFLARLYEKGDLVEKKDLTKALHYYQMAADLKDEEACRIVEDYNREKNKTNEDKETPQKQGKVLSKEAIDKILADIGKMSLDMENKKEEFYALMEKGEALSGEELYDIGNHYLHGEIVKKNMEEAVKWWKLAAKKGNVDAYNNLGVAYQNGDGVEVDEMKAFEYYKKAAEGGCIASMSPLAAYYLIGDLVPYNKEEALRLLLKAVKEDDSEAEGNLGSIYNNDGDYETAYFWNAIAARKGKRISQGMLGYYYYVGKGAPQNYERSFYWYCKAAKQGDLQGIYGKGLCYYDGLGVKQDKELGLKLLKEAAEQDYNPAKMTLEEIKNELCNE